MDEDDEGYGGDAYLETTMATEKLLRPLEPSTLSLLNVDRRRQVLFPNKARIPCGRIIHDQGGADTDSRALPPLLPLPKWIDDVSDVSSRTNPCGRSIHGRKEDGGTDSGKIELYHLYICRSV
jgi:hypothetical protein